MNKQISQDNVLRYALVTGASRGLGKAIALELAARGIPTILTGTNERVKEVCEEIRTYYGTPSICFKLDLTDVGNLKTVADTINAQYQVYLLVNNAGVGGTKDFVNASDRYLAHIVDLNVRGTVLFTHQLLPNLLRQKRSHILNIGSMAALSPIGYKTVYPASKSFVFAFSLALREELKHTPVTVSVASPGAMATNPEVCTRIRKQGFLGRLTLKPTDTIARKCVRQTLRGKRHIIVNPLSYFASSIFPNCIKTPILTNIVKKEIKNK